MGSHTPPLIRLPESLEAAKINGLPSTAYYIADFITEDEERLFLQKIEAAPKPRWKQLSKRRLQTWPSDLTKNTLLESPLPQWLTEPIIPRLQSCNLMKDSKEHIFSASPHGLPNHVLINEYLPGQGIMPHKDGSAYYPVVATVSLGASLCFDIYATNPDGTREQEPLQKIFQEPRSLLITTEALYIDYMHGISDIETDVDLNQSTVANWDMLRSPDEIHEGRYNRGVRTSLTYRDVLKVSKLGGKIGMFGRR